LPAASRALRLGHPFNPPHLIPLVEIVGGAKTSEETIRRATKFYTSIGKQTVRLNREVPGHVANRLQAALAREVYYLIDEGVVSVADIDTALCWGPGLRWGIMGQVMLNHLGGGQGGTCCTSLPDRSRPGGRSWDRRR
jgi:3-hydroxyacyl-CoA dehydrogenase